MKFKNHYAIFKEQTFFTSLVEMSGLEPLASCVQGRRSPN
jgi:hypothetical protein